MSRLSTDNKQSIRTYHHGHLVKGRLSVEEDNIPILQVPLNLVAWLQVHITVLSPVAKVKALPILSDDEASASLAWGWMRTILYQLLQPA